MCTKDLCSHRTNCMFSRYLILLAIAVTLLYNAAQYRRSLYFLHTPSLYIFPFSWGMLYSTCRTCYILPTPSGLRCSSPGHHQRYGCTATTQRSSTLVISMPARVSSCLSPRRDVVLSNSYVLSYHFPSLISPLDQETIFIPSRRD